MEKKLPQTLVNYHLADLSPTLCTNKKLILIFIFFDVVSLLHFILKLLTCHLSKSTYLHNNHNIYTTELLCKAQYLIFHYKDLCSTLKQC